MARRDPTIETTPIRLQKTLDELIKNNKIEILRNGKPVDTDKLSRFIVRKLVKIRPIRTINFKAKTKSKEYQMISKAIYTERSKRNHRNNKMINSRNRSWSYFPNIHKTIKDFAEEFDLDFLKAVNIYIPLACKVIGSSWRINFMASDITLDKVKEIYNDDSFYSDQDKEDIKDFYMVYHACIKRYTGHMNRIPKDVPLNQLNYYNEARLLAEEFKMDYEDFVDFLFGQFHWHDSIPSPQVLSSDRSREYLLKRSKERKGI